MSAQEVQITLRSEQGVTRPATATLTRYERGERMGRAVGFAALGLVGAGIFVVVPALHLITTWLLPLAGLLAARSAWRTEAKLTDARGECPACGAKITLSGGQLTDAPLWDACSACSRPLCLGTPSTA
jgi:hypothetical protein